MSAWLAAAEVAVVTAAVVGAVFLRRHADREWRRRQIAALPAFQEVAANFVRFQIVLRDAMTPSLQEAARAVARLGQALGELPPLPREPWWRRALIRVRAWFA